MELAGKIKQLRQKANLTQEKLADELGISPQSVSKWENRVAMPDITLLPKIAEVFGVSIDELFDLTVEQRFNRIENRMDLEEELPHEVFKEYEEFLKSQTDAEAYDVVIKCMKEEWNMKDEVELKDAIRARDALLARGSSSSLK